MPLLAHLRIRIVVRRAVVALAAAAALVTTAALIGATGTAHADVKTAPAHRLMAACVCWG